MNIARCRNAVISTGGGVVLDNDSMAVLRQNGIIITLTAAIDVILERTARRDTRPLLERPDKQEFVTTLLQQREELYQTADLVIDTSNCSPFEVTDKIIAFLQRTGDLTD